MRASRAGRLAEGQRCAIRAYYFPKKSFFAVFPIPAVTNRQRALAAAVDPTTGKRFCDGALGPTGRQLWHRSTAVRLRTPPRTGDAYARGRALAQGARVVG
eukprot:5001312-Prymnesium_polylepis.2